MFLSPRAGCRRCDRGSTAPTRQYGENVTSLPEESPSLIREDDRDAAVRRLQEAYAEGLIAHEVLDKRLHQVLSAATRGAWRVPRVLKVESAYGRGRNHGAS